MRAPLLLAALAALSACGNNNQADNTQNADENLSAESIVSNDVTAIDAVTGDAANMAADVDMNFGNLDENAAETALNEGAPKPRTSAPKKLAPRTESNTTANTATNAATNAE